MVCSKLRGCHPTHTDPPRSRRVPASARSCVHSCARHRGQAPPRPRAHAGHGADVCVCVCVCVRARLCLRIRSRAGRSARQEHQGHAAIFFHPLLMTRMACVLLCACVLLRACVSLRVRASARVRVAPRACVSLRVRVAPRACRSACVRRTRRTPHAISHPPRTSRPRGQLQATCARDAISAVGGRRPGPTRPELAQGPLAACSLHVRARARPRRRRRLRRCAPSPSHTPWLPSRLPLAPWTRPLARGPCARTPTRRGAEKRSTENAFWRTAPAADR